MNILIKKPDLTIEQAKALVSINEGADVYCYATAKSLREVQKKYPDFVSIGKPQVYTGDGTDQVPYFGAIATERGLKAAERILK